MSGRCQTCEVDDDSVHLARQALCRVVDAHGFFAQRLATAFQALVVRSTLVPLDFKAPLFIHELGSLTGLSKRMVHHQIAESLVDHPGARGAVPGKGRGPCRRCCTFAAGTMMPRADQARTSGPVLPLIALSHRWPRAPFELIATH